MERRWSSLAMKAEVEEAKEHEERDFLFRYSRHFVIISIVLIDHPRELLFSSCLDHGAQTARFWKSEFNDAREVGGSQNIIVRILYFSTTVLSQLQHIISHLSKNDRYAKRHTNNDFAGF